MGWIHSESAKGKNCCEERLQSTKTENNWEAGGKWGIWDFSFPNSSLLTNQTCGSVWLDCSHAEIYLCYFQRGNPSETRANETLSIKMISFLRPQKAFSEFDLKSITQKLVGVRLRCCGTECKTSTPLCDQSVGEQKVRYKRSFCVLTL